MRSKLLSMGASQKANALKSLLVSPKRGDHYVISSKSDDALVAFFEAYEDGYIVDYVLVDGPCPNQKWEQALKVAVPASPTLDTHLVESVLPKTPKELESRSFPAPAKDLESDVEDEDDSDWVPFKRNKRSDVDRVLGEIVKGPQKVKLPVANDPGMPPPLSSMIPSGVTSSFDPAPLLPSPEAVVSSKLTFAPVPFAKDFALEQFVLSLSLSYQGEDSLVLRDGEIKVKQNQKKINTPKLWSCAFLSQGRYLDSISDPKFDWIEYTLYHDKIMAFFEVYDVRSVIAFHIEFSKWRRWWKLLWSSENAYLRDSILVVRTIQPSTVGKFAGQGSRNASMGA